MLFSKKTKGFFVEVNESSVLFSLRELMTLEEQRIRDERIAEARRLARVSEAASEEDQQRRREDLARQEVEQSRRIAEAERARAEAPGEARATLAAVVHGQLTPGAPLGRSERARVEAGEPRTALAGTAHG